MTALKEIFTKTWGGLAATEIIAIDWVIRLSKTSVINKKSSHFLLTMTTKNISNKVRISRQQSCIRAREEFMGIQRPEKLEGVESTEEPQTTLDVFEIRIVGSWGNIKDLHFSCSPSVAFIISENRALDP